MGKIPMVQLNNHIKIPQLGLGVYKVPPDKTYSNVRTALELGYRHIDTASFYENEAAVGKAVKDSGLDRREIFITTKVWNDRHGYTNTLAAFEESIEKLGLDYIDLYLIHWPMPGTYIETWQALEQLYKEGRVRAIGVSNFLEDHLKHLLEEAEIVPSVNQIELHPKLIEKNTITYCREQGIAISAWSPLGKAHYLDDPTIVDIGLKYKKTSAQIIIRWHLQNGFIVIPKSLQKNRQQENISVFDFELSDEEMELINGLNEGYRIGTHPNDIHKRIF